MSVAFLSAAFIFSLPVVRVCLSAAWRSLPVSPTRYTSPCAPSPIFPRNRYLLPERVSAPCAGGDCRGAETPNGQKILQTKNEQIRKEQTNRSKKNKQRN